ncbi:MAG TPA: glycosyltransferase domain-containing protein, partial [Flavitalea sp.]|nr:glycosyltransferase domain-containing protein [Flavitalea sp.]
GSPRRTSKLYKIMFHLFIEDHCSIWVDASFIINCDLDEWMKRFRSPMTLLQHPKRDCVYKEAEACIRNKRDKESVIRKQVELYRALGLPPHNGMAASGIMMREKTEETIQFAELWYQELLIGCYRDQISYAYANWKYPITHLTNWDYTCRHEFLHVPHLAATDKRKARLEHYKKLKLL